MKRTFLLDISRKTNLSNKIPEKIKYRLKSIYSSMLFGSEDFLSMFVVEVETITACNRRCAHCPNSKFDRGLKKNTRKMDRKIFYKLIDELSEYNFTGEIHPHFYGEPLMDERLPEFVEYTRKKLPFAKIIIYTNGDFLTIDTYQKLSKSGVAGFFVTQHPPGELKEVRKVLNYINKHGDDGAWVACNELNQYNTRGGLIELKNAVHIDHCGLPSRHITIDHNGNIILCCRDYFSTIKFGNIRDEKLLDIWKKPRYKKIREELRKGMLKLEICKKCKVGTL